MLTQLVTWSRGRRSLNRQSTQGPSWRYLQSQFFRDLVIFWQCCANRDRRYEIEDLPGGEGPSRQPATSPPGRANWPSPWVGVPRHTNQASSSLPPPLPPQHQPSLLVRFPRETDFFRSTCRELRPGPLGRSSRQRPLESRDRERRFGPLGRSTTRPARSRSGARSRTERDRGSELKRDRGAPKTSIRRTLLWVSDTYKAPKHQSTSPAPKHPINP